MGISVIYIIMGLVILAEGIAVILLLKKSDRMYFENTQYKKKIDYFKALLTEATPNMRNYLDRSVQEFESQEERHVTVDRDARKIYNSSGVEIKRAILGPLYYGYICPTCGLAHCGNLHCLRCGQPLRYNEFSYDAKMFREQYKDLENEIAALEEGGPYFDALGRKMPTLSEKREYILNDGEVDEFVIDSEHGRIIYD